jgi:hypothetical protein
MSYPIPGVSPGSYELRLYTNGSYTRVAVTPITVQYANLSASPSTVNPGGTVTVSWSGLTNPTSVDWIGFFSPGAADTFSNGRYTNGAASGSMSYPIPGVSPGSYELRLYTNGSYTRVAVTPVTVK